MNDWGFQPGSWQDLVDRRELTDLGEVPLVNIGVPWAWNVHCHHNYNRLFWDVHENGLKTPLLLRSWDWPPLGNRGTVGCKEDGNRIDQTPAPEYPQFEEPEYELVVGNLRYCALYVQKYQTAPCLIIPTSEQFNDVEKLWAKYHPIFEGNWYEHPDYGFPSGGTRYVDLNKQDD